MTSSFDRLTDALLALPVAQQDVLIPILIVMFKSEAPSLKVPPGLTRLVADFQRDLGLAPDAAPETIRSAIHARCQAVGVTASALRDLVLQVANPSSTPADFAKILGSSMASVKVDKAPPSEGSVPAGPFARFTADKTFK